jgi:magnesium/cobalt transport protein CorA
MNRGSSGVEFLGMSFDISTMSARHFGFEDLDHELRDERVFTWIDVQAWEIDVFNDVLRRVGIDLQLVSQFHQPEVLPRLVERSDCIAFYLYEIIDPDRHLDTTRELSEIEFSRMILVLGHDYVLTYHQRPLQAVNHLKETAEASFKLAGKTPGFIAFLFLQRCLYDYAHLNLANDNFLDLLGDIPATQRADLSEKIHLAGSNILTLKKLVTSLQIVLMSLVTKRSPFISGEARFSYAEMLHNVGSIRAAIDSSHDLLRGFVGTMQARAAERTSEIARVLTVVSAIILPLTLITGIYGMNFEYMPELSSTWGYFAVLGVMAVLAIVLLAAFRKLGWLGSMQRR